MGTLIGAILIIVFVLAIYKKLLSPYVALIVVPVIFGVVYCLITNQSPLEVFDWIYEGVFYKVGEDGKVAAGTVRSALMVLFACSYFTLMMQVGLFDPLVIAIIKLVKGDPLKIIVASTLTAAMVSLDGDGTSTVLITTAAFMPLYRQFKIKGIYLAILIALPTSVFNMTPWGGPLARVLSALNLDVTELFPRLLPGMAVVRGLVLTLL
ncbi:SLC13 family permease [Clostridium sp.]|uniref:SLC13 family permease n=1 Tax=Clostridium sp. TaxID=1506 RepID=UPI003464889C